MSSDPIEAGARLQLAILELLRATVSPARPLVIVLDDLQWASAGQLSAFVLHTLGMSENAAARIIQLERERRTTTLQVDANA